MASLDYVNLLFIDKDVVDAQYFANSANPSTFPLMYSMSSLKPDILALLQKTNFKKIKRIGIVFTSTENAKQFLDGKSFFDSENVEFIVSLIKEFSVSTIDYLACNTLNYPDWVNYFQHLTRETGVTVGASDDKTGNLKYGGDWVMESTSQDIETIYFTKSIQYYKYLLDAPVSLYPTWADLSDGVTGMYTQGDFMYVSSYAEGFISKLNLSDGSVVKKDFIHLLGGPCGLTGDGSNLYVADSAFNTISKYNIETGASVNINWVTGLSAPTGLVIHGGYMYVTNRGDGSISRVLLANSTDKTRYWATGLSGPIVMVVYEEHLYVTTTLEIVKLKISDGSVSTYSWGSDYPYTVPALVVLSGTYMYVSDSNYYSIVRLNLIDGTFDNYRYLLGGVCNTIYIYGQYLFVAFSDNTTNDYIDRIIKLDIGIPTTESFTTTQLKQAGYNAAQLQQTGYTAVQVQQAGYPSSEVLQAGFTTSELEEAGYIISPIANKNAYYHTFYTTSVTNPTIMTRSIYDNLGILQETKDISFGGMKIADVFNLMEYGGQNPYTIGIVDFSLNKICMNQAYSNVYTKALTARQQSVTMTYVNTTYKEPHTYANFVYTVTVSGGVYWLATGGGAASKQPSITFGDSMMYVFDQSHASNLGNTLVLGQTRDSPATKYTTNVIINGTAGNMNAYTLLDLSGQTLPSPALKYFSNTTSSMGQPGVPAAPTVLSATPSNSRADVTFSPPDTGGAAITGYTLTVATLSESVYTTVAGAVQTWSGTTSVRITGLTNGTTYYFSVYATNIYGAGTASNYANCFTTPVTTVPDPPTILTATSGRGTMTVTFSANANNGGAVVNNYTVTAYTRPAAVYISSGITGSLNSSTPSAITLTGLTTSTTYYFAVTARNAIGTSLSSDYLSRIPATVPGVPTSVTVTRSGRSAIFTWASPGDDGGSPITSYDYMVQWTSFGYYPGWQTGSTTSLSYTYNNEEREVVFKVSAKNAIGSGNYSSQVTAPYVG